MKISKYILRLLINDEDVSKIYFLEAFLRIEGHINEIVYCEEKIGVIAKYPTGWTKEINLVSWNECPAKYDIRDWNDDHIHMSRGITLTESERYLDLTDSMAEKYGKMFKEPLQLRRNRYTING